MNIQELIQRVRNSLSPHESLPNEAVQGFLRVLEQVREEELSCKEINAKLDNIGTFFKIKRFKDI